LATSGTGGATGVGRRRALPSQRFGIVHHVFGDLDVRLGVPPLLLVELVAGMHQLDLATGHRLPAARR
jgi:hypothetical protein